MIVTTRYVGTQRGNVDYLFFLLTEDYLDSSEKIGAAIRPTLERFAQNLGDSGTLVRPFAGSAEQTLGDILQGKSWSEDAIQYMRDNLPALLITSVSFDEFDPTASQYALIFLRDLIDKHGNVEVFELEKLLSRLLEGAKNKNIFEAVDEFQRERDIKIAKEAIDIKPAIFGMSLDLKKVWRVYSGIDNRSIKL